MSLTEKSKKLFLHTNNPSESSELELNNLFTSSPEILECVINIFSNSKYFCDEYSIPEIESTLWYICSDNGMLLDSVNEQDVSISIKIELLSSIKELYQEFFYKHCKRELLHNQSHYRANSIEGLCYMFWDMFPTFGKPEDIQFNEFDKQSLQTLSTILSIDHIGIQESALHGLGHWQLNYPRQTHEIMSKFFMKSEINPLLIEYAKLAISGRIQ